MTRGRPVRATLVLIVVLAPAADTCAQEIAGALTLPAAGPAQEGAGSGTPTAIAAIEWSECQLEGVDGPLEAECATVSMPRFHGRETGDTFSVAVARHRGGAGPGTRLWYVDGGPGDAGIDALGRLRAVFPEPEIDLYAFDHRGVGRSGRLGCPEQESPDSAEGTEITADEWPACIEHIRTARDDLDALSTTQAAHDLAALVAAQEPGEDVIFGASYGTYLVNRYLLLYPDQPDAVILDGLVPADWTFAEFDRGLDTTGNRLLERCADDAECAKRLGPDPAARARQLAARFDAGHCAALDVDGRTIRLLLGNLLMGGPEIWPYIPTLIYRLEKCRLRDLLAVGSLVETLFEAGELGEPASHSPVLQRHVALSEMWPVPPPDPDRLAAEAAEATMTTEVSASFARTAPSWPTYPRPATRGRFADYGGPLLLLHGGLDPTMPPERLEGLLAAFDGPGTTFVLFPNRGHVVLNDNPCARRLYVAFLRDPTASLDTSCVAEAPSFRPTSLPPDADSAYGTPDLWGDSLSPQERQLIFFGTVAFVLLTGTVWVLVRRWRRRR